MSIIDNKENLGCRLASLVNEEYRTKVYGLGGCNSDYTKQDVKAIQLELFFADFGLECKESDCQVNTVN